MVVPKNLADVAKEEQKKFINSFDIVLSDLDGVVWLNLKPIPGASNCMKSLKSLGKQVHYVSNNGITSPQIMVKSLNDAGFDLTPHDLVVPSEATVHYLKKINFKKHIFTLCMQPMKSALEKNGFKLVPDVPCSVEEEVSAVLAHNEDNFDVGAVIVDIDFNSNYLKLQKAFWYLKNPDCLLLVAQIDKTAPFGPKGPIIGPYYFAETLKDLSGKDFILMGKPSQHCVNYIKDKFNISQPNRVLFVGDSIHSDMHIGAIGGFQKLLVLSGIDKLENVQNWKYPEHFKPEYYVENLDVVNTIIKSVFHTDTLNT